MKKHNKIHDDAFHGLWSSTAGFDISRESGSQAPIKSSGSHEMFVVIHAVLARIWLQGISIFTVKRRNSSYHTQPAGNSFLLQDEASWHCI